MQIEVTKFTGCGDHKLIPPLHVNVFSHGRGRGNPKRQEASKLQVVIFKYSC